MAFGETIATGEDELFRAFAEELGALQRERAAERGGVMSRALHLKQHHGAVGELVLKAPDSARHGVFSMAVHRSGQDSDRRHLRELAPWVDLATLTLPQQDGDSPRGREITELVSRLSFDPWHASEEHRPLGQIMRARKVAHGVSVVARGAAPEPTSVLSAQP